MSVEDTLPALEGLLNELFGGSTTSDRLQEITKLLENFSQQASAWRYCVHFMQKSGSDYVLMYSLKVFEDVVSHMWTGLAVEEKEEVRKFLVDYAVSRHATVTAMVRNKLAKVIVDIARQDWPHHYPEFFETIVQLLTREESRQLALCLVLTLSQELSGSREDLSMRRREQLRSLVLERTPVLVQILTSLLQETAAKQEVSCLTPPASPATSLLVASPPGSRSASPIPFQVGSPSSFLKQPSFGPIPDRSLSGQLTPLGQNIADTAELALECTAHLFSWVPLNCLVNDDLVMVIFHFAGCACLDDTNSSNKINYSLGCAAMACINEVMSRAFMPAAFDNFMMKVFQQTLLLLKKMVDQASQRLPLGMRSPLAHVDEKYLLKFTEFIHYFMANHIKRVEENSSFPLLEFLLLFYRYTSKQPHMDGYMSCLEIWMDFIEYLATHAQTALAAGGESAAQQRVARYEEALVVLMNSVVDKAQFRFNSQELVELDDDPEGEELSEWQSFLNCSLEVVEKVASIFSIQVFRRVWPQCVDLSEKFINLKQSVRQSAGGVVFEGAEPVMLINLFKDFATMLQAAGRLAGHFCGEKFLANIGDCQAMLECLLQVAVVTVQEKMFAATSANGLDVQISAALQLLVAELLGSLRAYTHWLAQYYMESLRQQQDQDKVVALVSTICDVVVPLLQPAVKEQIQLSAAHLFLSIAITVRPQFLLALPAVQNLLTSAAGGQLSRLPEKVFVIIYRALASALLLPWPGVPEGDQQWPARSGEVSKLVAGITTDFLRLPSQAGFAENSQLQQSAKPHVRCSLIILKQLAESVENEPTRSKALLHQALLQPIETGLFLFPVYISQPDIASDILGFFLAIFASLKTQVGAGFTQRTVESFMALFSNSQLREILTTSNKLGCEVVEKFLGILQLLVQERASFKSFLPNIIQFCMEQVYPIIAERPEPDVKMVLFGVLKHVLLVHWRLFFPNVLMSRMDSQVPEPVQHQELFVAIMQAFGQSFLQPDINIFRHNLQTMEEVNARCKLYGKELFRQGMLPQFLGVFLQVLVHKSHDLLADEISLAIYNMATVDFNLFFTHLLPQFVVSAVELTEEQKQMLAGNFSQDKDLPSFSRNMKCFLGDLRYFHIINRCLPAGSVKL